MKLLILDADGVLWAGVAGDHTHPFYNVQQVYRDMGVPLALLTRNTAEHIEEAFADPRNVLSMWDFEVWEFECADKPDAIRRLTGYLNLDLADVTYVDDEKSVCAAVAAALPELRVVHQPLKTALGVARELAGLPALPVPERTGKHGHVVHSRT